MKNKVKIFVSYKDKHKIIKSDIITPIQTGRAIADEIFEDMIGDDTGDNISSKNHKYNELSAQYWVWKHYEEIGNPDYVGFMHYRRHFVFDNNILYKNQKPWLPGIPIYKINASNNKVTANLMSEKIEHTLSDNPDCIVIKSYDIRKFNNNNLYIREHYLNTIIGAKREVYTVFYNTVKKLYPEYTDILEKFTYGHRLNCCNMFIMKKEIFFKCCEFYFNILNEIDKNIDSKNYNSQELRFLGFIGEYILTLFIMKMEDEKNNYIKYLDALFIQDTNDEDNTYFDIFKNFKILENIFSLTNTTTHKIFRFFGIKIKFKRKQLDVRLARQEYMLNLLNNKITELQEEMLKRNYEYGKH